ncbi:MAG: hypothetical protein Unbinned5081contig1002_20 [Prokaryotic dsDNA virus sp.]|nr:MAG: hypothetical protein Unbinned5081contig1002_20 [Prokaryotic dsDNA virus sp.]|tara:strand:- start:2305 stop:2514 length:210 start_codon:yes stop_codon:yes gene_type:complete
MTRGDQEYLASLAILNYLDNAIELNRLRKQDLIRKLEKVTAQRIEMAQQIQLNEWKVAKQNKKASQSIM